MCRRGGERCFRIHVSQPARGLLLQRGTSQEYGARELKRVIHRLLTQPLAARVARGLVPPGSLVDVGVTDDGTTLALDARAMPPQAPTPRVSPATVLVVDDNQALAAWMGEILGEQGFAVRTAGTALDGMASAAGVDVAVLDYLFPTATASRWVRRSSNRADTRRS